MKYLLDSVILIDHFNGVVPASDFLADHGSACAISVFTRAEVLTGFDADAARLAGGLLDLFPALPMDTTVADMAARLCRELHLKLPDALQAAVALQHRRVLVTRNTRDFQSDAHLDVLVPYRL